MNTRFILVSILVLSLGCNNRLSTKDESANVKWYFYSYASTLTGYINGGEVVSPLVCSLNCIDTIQENKDSTKVYLNAFFKDTSIQCTFKPLDLIGIRVIKQKYYLPIYHAIDFDSLISDEDAYEYMKKQEQVLMTKITENKNSIDKWLLKEARNRNMLK